MSKLLIDEPPLQVLPGLAVAFGLNEAIIVQQLHYWLRLTGKKHRGVEWVYNSIPAWQEQFPFWSETTVKRTLKSLIDQEVIIIGNFNKDNRDRTKWYTINYSHPALRELMHQVKMTSPSGQNDLLPHQVKMTSPLPETTEKKNTERGDLRSPNDETSFCKLQQEGKEERVEEFYAVQNPEKKEFGKKKISNRIPKDKIVDLYHSILPTCPQVIVWNNTRQGYLRQRWLHDLPDIDSWKQFFEKVSRSRFLTGQSEGNGSRKPFVADLEWLIRPTNFAKIIEDKYHE